MLLVQLVLGQRSDLNLADIVIEFSTKQSKTFYAVKSYKWPILRPTKTLPFVYLLFASFDVDCNLRGHSVFREL